MSGCAGGGGGVVRDRETLEAVVGKAATQSLSSHLAARPVTVPRRHGSVWGWWRTHWCRERGGSTLRQQRRGGTSVHRWWSARTGGQDGELEVTGSPPSPLPPSSPHRLLPVADGSATSSSPTSNRHSHLSSAAATLSSLATSCPVPCQPPSLVIWNL